MFVADQVWVATALLHRDQPGREWFSPQEIRQRAESEGLGPLAAGFQTHVSQMTVANRRPNPSRHRFLFAVDHGRLRLFRSTDPIYAGRTGRQVPKRADLPERYRPLLDWYAAEYDWPITPESIVRETPAAFVAESATPRDFEFSAAQALTRHFGTELRPGSVGDVAKRFDFVSADGSIVGDAKYFTMVGGARQPPAKFSIIAEHVWLLEKVPARERVLVFGNQREVPVAWLRKYGHLAEDVRFFFLGPDGVLEELSHRPGDDAGWASVSARSFARDWNSKEDSVYDDLPAR